VTRPTIKKASPNFAYYGQQFDSDTESKLLTLLGIDDANPNKTAILSRISNQVGLLKKADNIDNAPKAGDYVTASQRLKTMAINLINELADTNGYIIDEINKEMPNNDLHPSFPLHAVEHQLAVLFDTLTSMEKKFSAKESRGAQKKQTQGMVVNGLRAMFQKYAVNQTDQKLFNPPNALTDYEQREVDFIVTAMNSFYNAWNVKKVRRLFTDNE
jgi:hypothetical protein